MSDLFYRAIKAQRETAHIEKPRVRPVRSRTYERTLTDDQIINVLSLWADATGMRKHAIAAKTGLSQSTVSNVIRRYEFVDGRVTHIKRDIE